MGIVVFGGARDPANDPQDPITLTANTSGPKTDGDGSTDASQMIKRIEDTIQEVRHRFHGDEVVFVQPLVVMVADPVQTGLDWAFDQHVKAVRKAYEAADFTLAHHDMPWRRDERGRSFRDGNRPGLLVYHRTEGHLVAPVFLVAESPTAAIPPTERAAMKIAVEASLSVASQWPPSIRVVGPIFSGSAAPLVHALAGACRAAAPKTVTQICIVNGSATAAGLDQNIRDAATQHRNMTLTVASTVLSDASYRKAIETLATNLRIKPEACYIISESGTTYSQDMAAGHKGDFWGKCNTITFPSHITHVRKDYSQHWEVEQARRVSGRSGSRFIDLNLDDASNASLAPTPLSDLTDAIVDQRLIRLLQDLRDRRPSMVILIATDVRDTILLGREIARRLPDVQLVTTEANLLYLRRELSASQRGMLVVSSASLAPGHDWGKDVRNSFGSDMECGIYAATLSHIDAVLPTSAKLLEKAMPTQLGTGVCINAVGMSRMVPIARIELADLWPKTRPPKGDPGRLMVAGRQTQPPSTPAVDWRLQMVVLAVGAAFSCAFVVAARRRSRAVALVTTLLKQSLGKDHQGTPAYRYRHGALVGVIAWRYLVHALSAALAICVSGQLMTGFAADPSVTGEWMAGVSAVLIGLGLWLAFHAACDARAAVGVGQSMSPGSKLAWSGAVAGGVAVLFSTLLAVCLAYSGWSQLLHHTATARSLYAQRVWNISEFVSPLWPQLLLAVGLMGWAATQARRSWECRSMLDYEHITRRESVGGKPCAPTRGTPLEIRELLIGAWSPGWIGLSALAICALVVLSTMAPYETLEAASCGHGWLDYFGVFVRWGMVTISCVMVVNCARIVAVWRVVAEHTLRLGPGMLAGLRRAANDPELTIETDLATFPPASTGRRGTRGPRNNFRTWLMLGAANAPRSDRRALPNAVRNLADSYRPWIELRAAEVAPEVADYLTSELVVWLRWVLNHLRHLAWSILALMLTGSALLWSYPLHPHTSLSGSFVVTSLMVIGTLLHLALAISRNPALSILTKTEPGHVTVNRALVSTVIMYVALPTFAFVMAQLPELGSQALGWIEPLIRAAAR